MSDHYSQLAMTYDECYGELLEEKTALILCHLQLSASDQVVDVGGGTGALLEAVYKAACLKSPGICVEPSTSMLSNSAKNDDVIRVHATAEAFFTDCAKRDDYCSFNKVIMASVVHHFSDPELVFDALAKILPTGGKCIIITRESNTTLPFFMSAMKAFAESCQGVKNTVGMLNAAGLEVNVIPEVLQLQMKKSKWYFMLRERFMSHLKALTHSEVEAGIKELDEGYFCDVSDDDIVTIEDNVKVIIASK